MQGMSDRNSDSRYMVSERYLPVHLKVIFVTMWHQSFAEKLSSVRLRRFLQQTENLKLGNGVPPQKRSQDRVLPFCYIWALLLMQSLQIPARAWQPGGKINVVFGGVPWDLQRPDVLEMKVQERHTQTQLSLMCQVWVRCQIYFYLRAYCANYVPECRLEEDFFFLFKC